MSLNEEAADELAEWASECGDIAGYSTIEEDRESYEERSEEVSALAEALRGSPLQYEGNGDYRWDTGKDDAGVWLMVGTSSVWLRYDAERGVLIYQVLPVGDEAAGEVYDEGSIALI